MKLQKTLLYKWLHFPCFPRSVPYQIRPCCHELLHTPVVPAVPCVYLFVDSCDRLYLLNAHLINFCRLYTLSHDLCRASENVISAFLKSVHAFVMMWLKLYFFSVLPPAFYCLSEELRSNHLPDYCRRNRWFTGIWFSASHLFGMFVCSSFNCFYYNIYVHIYRLTHLTNIRTHICLFCMCPYIELYDILTA